MQTCGLIEGLGPGNEDQRVSVDPQIVIVVGQRDTEGEITEVSSALADVDLTMRVGITFVEIVVTDGTAKRPGRRNVETGADVVIDVIGIRVVIFLVDRVGDARREIGITQRGIDLGEIEIIKRGGTLIELRKVKVYQDMIKMKFSIPNDDLSGLDKIEAKLERSMDQLEALHA